MRIKLNTTRKIEELCHKSQIRDKEFEEDYIKAESGMKDLKKMR